LYIVLLAGEPKLIVIKSNNLQWTVQLKWVHDSR